MTASPQGDASSIASTQASRDEEPPPLILESLAGRVPVGFSPDRWNDWRWHMTRRIRRVDQLLTCFPALRGRADLSVVINKYPMSITPYYASLIEQPTLSDPIFQMAVPQLLEMADPAFLSPDPLEEGQDMPVPGLVHRYTDRALLIATTTCSMYCRHCTRKRVAGTRETTISPRRLEQVVAYLKQHPEIKDVIVSGGDPLTMPDDAIEQVLKQLRSVPSVEIIRIGTRMPVVLPMRITDELVNMLKKYHPLWINTHFNHPKELTPESIEACRKLADAGIPLGNQSVLLRGVNDKPEIIEQLCRGLVRTRVRPYYLYQCDLVRGVEHFRTPVARGIEIMEYLRGRLSGLAIPMFVVDVPHGGGKIPVLPNYVVSQSPTHTVLRNFEGMLVAYPEPYERWDKTGGHPNEDSATAVWQLNNGQNSRIQPARSVRQQRRKQQNQQQSQTSATCNGLFDDMV